MLRLLVRTGRLAGVVGAILLALADIASAAGTAPAADAGAGSWMPSTVFGQAGVGNQNTQAYALGATWDWAWRRQYRFASIGGYFEATFGRWVTDRYGDNGAAWMTQVGVTPVLRLRPSGPAADWFAEIGVGANFILPLFRSGDRRFSTEFNFGDHFALGRDFGKRDRHELALRVEHFSNAGINHPNPGENFTQLRYSYRF